MSVRKLSELDKIDILNLYRLPEETTSTLASRYGVSNSTISRLLKSRLSEQEYEALIQQKRATRTPSSESLLNIETETQRVEPQSRPVLQEPPEPTPTSVVSESSDSSERRRRKRSSAASQQEESPSLETDFQEPVEMQLPLFEMPITQSQKRDTEALEDNYANTRVIEEMLGEDLTDLDEEDSDLETDLDLDADLDDVEDEDDDDWDDDIPSRTPQLRADLFSRERGEKVEVLPLSEASLPKTCYLVVDRAAELIARPLKEFSDLGDIPAQEIQQKTLPVFDNHRVARRYSNRAQRVIKIPDGRMLQRTCTHLQAKGITRLLIDGQVYSL